MHDLIREESCGRGMVVNKKRRHNEINCQNVFVQEMVVSSPRQTVQDINLILMFGGEDINNRFYVGAKTKTG